MRSSRRSLCLVAACLQGALLLSGSHGQCGDHLIPPSSAGAVCNSVDIDGAYAVLGTPNAGTGEVHVFMRGPDDEWVLDAVVTADDSVSGDKFGGRVAISGHFLLVGAPWHDDQKGAAYLFQKMGSEWVQVKKLVGSGTSAGDKFGLFLDLSGPWAIASALEGGTTHFFKRHEGGDDNWGEVTSFTSGIDGGDAYGWSVSICGDTAVVGAMQDDEFGADAGAAYIYERRSAGWTLDKKITAPDAFDDAWFGHTVSVKNDRIVIGAIELYAGGPGAVYVFDRYAGKGGWGEVQKLSAPAGSNGEFGRGVAIDDNILVVTESTDNMSTDGAMHVYWRGEDGLFDPHAEFIRPTDLAFGDKFGHWLAMDSGTVIVASTLDDHDGGAVDAGSAYLYSVVGRSGDLTGDGLVNVEDLVRLILQWGGCGR